MPSARDGDTTMVTAADGASLADDEARPRAAWLSLPERYEDVRLLGSGGFGEVRRVWDRKLKRAVAMKILRPDVGMSAGLRARFLAEIELTAGLSHPGIVAVHDWGELPDGRLWFTMAEVRGRTLRAVIEEAFCAAEGRISRRRLLDLFARVCETVAYAHSRGVIHRDLKPDNVMIGPFAEVLVMDWGIGRARGAEQEPPLAAASTPAPAGLTQAGDVLGTPAYMAPEQARGAVDEHGPATDVYALGAMLHHVLVGRAPLPARAGESLDTMADVPPDLAAICRRATALEASARYADAGALSAEIGAQLEGARRREHALAALAAAREKGDALANERAAAEQARSSAQRALVGIRPSDPVEKKLPAWDLEDLAEKKEREVALRETEWIEAVRAALATDPALPEAHAALADFYRHKLIDAERGRQAADAARFLVMLRAHDRGEHAAFLRGDGALSLVTDPPGARVTIHRYVVEKRRLVLEPGRELGSTPLRTVSVPHGSYLLRIVAAGRREVRYPVSIGRGEHWDGVMPGGREPFPIALPREEDIGPDEIYVPAGFCWVGGDLEAADSLPRARVWIDAFILHRYAVTNQQWLSFLDDAAARGLDHAALGLPPSYPGLLEAAESIPGLLRDPAGRFGLRQDGPDRPLLPQGPAIVDGQMAAAYARWTAQRTGKPCRLPDELEREKAARGADGRLFPWGDQPEPTFACVLEVHSGEPTPLPVEAYPTDESPYGARGLGGTARDWCANVWRSDGPPIEQGRLVLEEASPIDDDFRSVRGGAWGSSITFSRAAARYASRPGVRRPFVGMRLARSYDDGGAWGRSVTENQNTPASALATVV
jgi:formylglycine-generating enzyme required for sulfatase activity